MKTNDALMIPRGRSTRPARFNVKQSAWISAEGKVHRIETQTNL